MRHLRPVLLAAAFALVLAVPLAAVAGAAPATPGEGATPSATATAQSLVVRDVPNTTNYLDIRQADVERGDRGESSLDVAGAVAMDVQRLRGEYSTRAFDAAYTDASGETARVRQLRAEVDRLDRRITLLEARQQTAIDAYNAGDISASLLVRRLVTVDVAARQIRAQFAHLAQSAGVSLPDALDDRIETMEADLVPLTGTVRERAGAAVTGQRPAMDVYALTSTSGLVLSTADDERFYREAHLPNSREPVGPDRFVTDDDPTGITAANERASQLYPWAYGDTGPSLDRFGRTSVYEISLDHSHGALTTFLDGTTETSFRELQFLQVERLPTRQTTNSTSTLAVRVNRTYGTGPMEVTATDPVTGAPVDATVVVNGAEVGTTGNDGSLWTVTPHRSVRIAVHTPETTVEVSFFAG